MVIPATGRQFEIREGNTRAVITEVGAGLREFEVSGHSILDTYSQDTMPEFSRGQVLLPWPNRIDGGSYVFEGQKLQLPLTEVPRQNAIHGLTRWASWQPTAHESNRLAMSLTLHAQEGYPFVLSLQIIYTLSPARLEVETIAHNVGSRALPYGAGYHPYLTVGTDVIDTAFLQIPAQSYFATNSRLIPVLPAVSVTGTSYDFQELREIGDTIMDTGFTNLVADDDGFIRVNFSAPAGGPAISIFMDSSHQFLQVFTGDAITDASRQRRGIAIEPYTCATDAFNNGLGLRILQPGESFSNVWGINVTGL